MTEFIAHLYNLLLHFTNNYMTHDVSSTIFDWHLKRLLQFSTKCSLGTLSLSLMLRPTVSRPVCLGKKHPSGAYDQIFFPFGIRNTSDSYVLDSVGGPLWREDGSVFCMCRWPLPAQSFSVLVPWDLRPYFTASDLRLPFSSPPTTRRVTVEVLDPASTRVTVYYS
jgi:hypothetical protein